MAELTEMREPGYYWISYENFWEVAYFDGRNWRFIGERLSVLSEDLNDKSIGLPITVGDKIERPSH